MRKITANDSESRSSDVVIENIERLKTLFPEVFSEGKIDFEVLKQLLGGEVDEHEEKYGLNWHGKRQARQLALKPSTGTLRPCPRGKRGLGHHPKSDDRRRQPGSASSCYRRATLAK